MHPTANLPELTVQLDASGRGSITAAQVRQRSLLTTVAFTHDVSQTDFDCTDVGANTVTLTVTDDNSNVSTCTSTDHG